jgi:ubiquinol-cytochrome c reductase cytochrome b subunit
VNIRWGDWSLVSLYLSLLSGLIVGIHYLPSEPFYSTSALDILVPYGAFFRSLHFYSSQLFFLFAVIHYLVVFNKSAHYDSGSYAFLILILPVSLLLLFTGYVLRSDSTGFSAGMIAEHILEGIPVVGSTLNNLLFSISENGLQRVYLHHVFSFDILLLILAWDHLRRYRVRVADHLLLICTILLFCLFVAAPLDPQELGVFYITGPWFFLGLQELLRYLPPFWAGVVFPSMLIISLVFLRNRYRWFHLLFLGVIIWLAGYALLSAMALTLHNTAG